MNYKGKNNPNFGTNKYNLFKKFLVDEYIINEKSMLQIAKIVGCATMTIFHKLKKYNIHRRTSSEMLKGRKRPEHSKIMKGRKNPKFKETRKTMIGILAPNYKNGEFLKQHFCLICDKEIWYDTWKNGQKHCQSCANRISMTGKIFSEETKKKISKTSSGKNNGMFGKVMKPNWAKYKNISMRSSWEIRFAQFLDLSNIKWKYESKTFDLGNTTYTPDFYLPEFTCYIEIKGYFSSKNKRKMTKFKKLYPEVRLELFKEKQLKTIGVLQ